uniref:Uncharacterized protein n=1 Tax=Anguilla anguilla TaxID=7936 RepID=A0A0E9PBT4_ANGAN
MKRCAVSLCENKHTKWCAVSEPLETNEILAICLMFSLIGKPEWGQILLSRIHAEGPKPQV